MAIVRIKGYEFNAMTVTNTYQRRAVQFHNNIINTLKQIGLTEDDSKIPMNKGIFAGAEADWYFNGQNMHYSYKQSKKFAENLFVVSKIIELEVEALVSKKITLEEFTSHFVEDKDVDKQRLEARKTLGLELETMDMEEINKAYKKLARKHHPDMENGCHEKFKEINVAHKILKRELN